MSIHSINAVWKSGKHSGGKLLLLLALADWADCDGECWPGIKAISAKSRMEERSVQRTLRELESEGEIKILMNAGKHSTNRYVLALHYREAEMETQTRGGDITTTPPVVTTSPPPGGNGVTPPVVMASPYPSVDTSERRTVTLTASEGDKLLEVDPLPPCLMEDWKAWKQHLKEKKIRRTESAERFQVKKLLEMGEVRAKAAIEFSIANSYQGIFEPRANFQTKAKPATEPIDYSNF